MRKLDSYTVDETMAFLKNTVKLDAESLAKLEGLDGTDLWSVAEDNEWEELGLDVRASVKIRAHLKKLRLWKPPAPTALALTNAVSSEPFVLQSEEPHIFIEKILKNQYVKGASILREALQNAEDARATQMHIALDLRQHPTDSLLQDDLRRCQGPALLLVNDSSFTSEDFESFKRMYRSGKADKPDSIGKFGRGSRSFFHITDRIFLLSSQTLVVVGPSNGMRYNMQQVQQYPDQLEPFRDFESMYPTSTIFRLPLRTQEMEQASPIKAPAFSVSDAEEMIQKFHNRLDRDLLFLKHVGRITAERWDAAGQREEIFSVGATATPPAELSGLSGFLHGKSYEELQDELQEKSKDPPTAEYDLSLETTGGQLAPTRWRVCQRLCVDRPLLELMKSVDCPPLIGVALPEEPGNHEGYICHLANSVRTGLPVHLHAALALSEDRRSLWKLDEDMQGESLHKPRWNEEMYRALASVYGDVLESRAENARYYDWWPDRDKVAQDWVAVVEELRRSQLDRACLWSPGVDRPGRRLVRPRDATVLSEDFGKMRELALGLADGAVVVPPRIEKFFDGDLRRLGYEDFLEAHVFPASRWRKLTSEQQDEILVDLLGRVAQSTPQGQAEWEQRLRGWRLPDLEHGFPTAEPGVRRSLTSLFDPTRGLAELIGDSSKLLSSDFAREDFLPTLRQLGLGSELDMKMLTAVATRVADEQDVERAQQLVKYLDRQGPEDLFDEDPVELFEDISWIPAGDTWCPPSRVVFDARARDREGYEDKIRPLLRQLKVRLCDLPQDAQKALLRVQQGELQELDRHVACKMLREVDVGSEILGESALELLDFLVRQLEAKAGDLEGVPLLKLESGELSRFHGAQRRFFSSNFFELQPLSPERFLHHDVDKVVHPENLPGWTKFGIDDIRPEGVLEKAQLEQLEDSGAVTSTEAVLAWVGAFLKFVDEEDCYEELGGEKWRSLPLIPTETEVLRLRESGPPVVDLSACREEHRPLLRGLFERIGCAALRGRLDVPERAREELCSEAPRLARHLLEKVGPSSSEVELTPQEKDVLSDFLLAMPSFAQDFLALPIFPVRGEHVAPSEKVWVESEALADLLRPFGVHLVADAAKFADFLAVEAPSGALRKAEPGIQARGGLQGQDLEDLVELSTKAFSPEERRELADLRLLPDGQRLRDKFRRADPLVQELAPVLQDALLPGDLEQRLSPEIRELLRAPDNAGDLDELLRIAEGGAEDIPRPEAFLDKVLERLERMRPEEIDALHNNPSFCARQVIPVRQPEGLRWCRPREVFVGSARQLVHLTGEPALGSCPPNAERLFAPPPRVDLVARQLRLLCEAPAPWREADFRPVYEALDTQLRRGGLPPEHRATWEQLRRMRCLLTSEGELEYPHLVCKDLTEDSAPFVPVPPLLRNCEALLTELQVKERAPRSLQDNRQLEDLREALYRDLVYTDLELLSQDGSIRAHRCVIFQECPGAALRAIAGAGGAMSIDLQDLTRQEVELLKEYIYRGGVKKSTLTLENAERLGRAAQDFRLLYLQDYLEHFAPP